MRRAWGGQTVEAVDYELVWVGNDPAREPLGAFADVHAVEEPVWRLVSGYLMLSGGADGELVVSSHGHPVAQLRADAGGLTLELGGAGGTRAGAGGVRVDGLVARTDAGIALVADAGTGLAAAPDGRTVTARPAGPPDAAAPAQPVWGVTVVHGPAETKIENRIRLLRSLERVGGRHV